MIIKSLLSCDFYKFSMLNVFFRVCPDVNAKYKFKCRNPNINLLPFKDEIEKEIDDLCNLKLNQEELDYLATIRFFNPAFVNLMEDFQLKRRYITVSEKDGNLDITMEGPLTNVTMFEIFVLKIVHEVYSRNVNPPTDELLAEGRNRLTKKIIAMEEFVDDYGFKPALIDFGGRRAYTVAWHEYVVKNLVNHNMIIGTSDVDLARRYNIKPMGTMAHEYIQTFQGLGFCPVMESQSVAFQTWADVYRGDLGIALSDTLGDAKFLVDFDPYFAKLFDGIRHDSGEPINWGNMIIAHYNAFKINLMTKSLVFSDGLDFDKMFELAIYFKDKINVSFGIGTSLSNDVGVPALPNVIKQTHCNGNPTAKLSNNPDKTMCEDKSYLDYLRYKLTQL